MVRVVFAVLAGAGLLLGYFVAYFGKHVLVRGCTCSSGKGSSSAGLLFLHRDFLEARSFARDSTLMSSDRSGDACPRVKEPKNFTGTSNDLKDWTFEVELGIRANRIVKEDHQA